MTSTSAFLHLVLSICILQFSSGDDHTRLTMLEREFFNWRLDDRPEFASSIGHYRNSDRLEHFDLKKMKARMEKAKVYLSEIQSIDIEKLSKPDQVDYTILEDMLQSYVDGYKWRQWNYMNPLSWLEGNQRDPFYFVESTPFDNRGDFENYIARLNEMPRLFQEYIAFFDEAIRLGRTSHMASIDRVPAQISYILEPPVEESVYFMPFLEYLEYFNKSIPKTVRKDIKKRGKQAVQAVYQAYEELKDYLENVYMNHTRSDPGVGSLAKGTDFYKACLNWYLSLNMTPEEIHELGVEEVKRVTERMQAIMKKQGYGGYKIRDYFAELKKRDDMFFHTEEEILQAYENIIFKRIEPQLNKLFRDQPGLPIKVEPMPSDGSRGQYISGTADGIRPGIFYANTFRKVPKYTMTSLAMHEANPGHHLQLSYEVTAALPDFRRNKEHSEKFRVPYAFPSYTAFVEGWALYAESLGEETNLYEKEYELMGYYESEIFRACRLVVDTGLHYFNWSRDTAIQYFENHTAESLPGIEVEVDRYITWPGQAVAYKIGELRIRDLREYAEEKLGEFFDVRDFHMVVLKNGAVPLSILESQVMEWVRDHKKELEPVGDESECECSETEPGRKSRCQRSSPTRKDISNPAKNTGSYVSSPPRYLISTFIGLFLILALYR